jgi:malonate-semialdehyde dehydrogenase (acetylating)/methylmalonate-semialdehyde dehydrogenase
VTREALNRVRQLCRDRYQGGRKLAVDGRGFKMQGYENGFYMGGCLFDNVTKTCGIYKEEIFGPVLSVVRAHDYNEALALPSDHDYGNGVAIFTRDGDAARDFAAKGQCRHGRHQRADPGADRLLHLRRLEESPALAISTSTARIRSASTPRPRRSPRAGPSGVKEGAEFSIPTMN